MEPEDTTQRRYVELPRSTETHKFRHAVGLFLYGFLRSEATFIASLLGFDRSIKLLDRPGLALEVAFRLGCGAVAGMIAFGLSAWVTKPLVYKTYSKWWAPWSYNSGYGVDALIVIIGIIFAILVMFVASTAGVLSIR